MECQTCRACNRSRDHEISPKTPNGVLALAFGPQGELLIAGRDKQVRLWKANGGAVKNFPTETALPLQTAVNFDGTVLLAGDDAGAVTSWKP